MVLCIRRFIILQDQKYEKHTGGHLPVQVDKDLRTKDRS